MKRLLLKTVLYEKDKRRGLANVEKYTFLIVLHNYTLPFCDKICDGELKVMGRY